MGLETNITLEKEVEEFRLSLEAIDMERVKKNTLKDMANNAWRAINKALNREENISFGLNSKYERGEGPSMFSRNAWVVTKKSNSQYTIRPHPKVEQRAVTLNYGYPGEITPDGDSPMRYTVKGTPRYRWAVSGPEATGYWNAAFRQMRDGKMKEIGERELRKELERHGLAVE